MTLRLILVSSPFHRLAPGYLSRGFIFSGTRGISMMQLNPQMNADSRRGEGVKLETSEDQ
jgi:hypothetical protein